MATPYRGQPIIYEIHDDALLVLVLALGHKVGGVNALPGTHRLRSPPTGLDVASRICGVLEYAPLHVAVVTPQLELRGATDDLLAELAPLVRDGKAAADPAPYDDPMSLYESDPALRVAGWLRGLWRGRGTVGSDSWRLYFAVIVDGRAVGMQDIIGDHFAEFGTVATFSWLSSDARRRGIGREMRHAALHLAFAGLGATEASSDAFVDNQGSNGVSRALGYTANGLTWATRQGQAAQLQRWRLTREAWQQQRRCDITLTGEAGCRAALGIPDRLGLPTSGK